MYCMNCGAEIENGTDICPVCHALLKSEDVLGDNYANYIQQEQTVLNSANKSTEKIHKRKKWGIGKKLLLTAGIFVIAVVILFVWFLKSPARQVISYVKSDKYERAYDTYSDDVKGNSVQEFLLKKLLEHELANIDKDYSEGKLEFDSVIGRINIIISLDIKEIDKIIEDKVVSIGAKIKDEYETQAAEYEISMLRLDDLSSLCMSENVQDKLSIMIADVQTLKESRDAYADAEKQYQSGNYDAALEKYALVSESDDNYEDAQGKIAECADSYRNKIIEQVASPESYDDYEYSISLVKIALGVLPEDQELGDRLTALTSEYAALLKGDALDKGTEYINSGNYADAFDLINKALEYNEGDTELTSFLASSQSSYESYITEQVNGFTASYDYDKAISVLDTALSVLPESTVLLGLKEETENNKPVKLCDMKIAESECYEQITDLVVTEDSMGNKYNPGNLFKTECVRWGNAYYNGYAKYYLNGEYKKFCGTVVASDDSEISACILTIYGDDKILYVSDVITRSTSPLKLELDVEGITWIHMEFSVPEDYSKGVYMRVLLADMMLYKN